MDDFIQKAVRTEAPAKPLGIGHELTVDRLLHAAMGLCTESGEFMDALKKHLFYNKPLDLTNLKEEIGDLLWYIALAMDAMHTDFNEEMERVIRKLAQRYPERFTEHQALNRDLAGERKVLEL